eukprot:3501954-Prymnesium_polylepis.1
MYRPCSTRYSAGTNVYCVEWSGSARHSVDLRATHGGPRTRCPASSITSSTGSSQRAVHSVLSARLHSTWTLYLLDNPSVYPGYPGFICVNTCPGGVFTRVNTCGRKVLAQYA